MSHPPCEPWKSEQDCKVLCREAHRLVDRATVEVDIRIEFARDEVLISQSDSFKFDGDVNKLFSASNREHFISNLLDNRSSWVVILVDTMTEAH